MDYMMLEPCTNECMWFTTDTDVMRELCRLDMNKSHYD